MATHPKTPPKRTFAKTVRWLLLSVAVVFVSFLIWGVVDMVKGPQVGEHVAAEAVPFDVPSDSTDVCYVTMVPFSPAWAFEFSISEASFITWAQEDGYTLQEIGAKPFEISRYKAIDGSESSNHFVVISDGLFFEEWSEPDACIKIAYDRQAKRAYKWVQTR